MAQLPSSEVVVSSRSSEESLSLPILGDLENQEKEGHNDSVNHQRSQRDRDFVKIKRYRNIILTTLTDASHRVINLSGATQHHPSDKKIKSIQPPPLQGDSLLIFSPNNFIRKTIYSLLQQKWLEFLLFLLLIVQLVVTAIKASSPIGKDTVWLSYWTDYVLFGIFIIHSIVLIAKCIANGFILFPENVKGSYEIQRNSKPEKDTLVPLPKDGNRTDDNQKRPSSSESNVLIPYLRHSFNRIDFIAIIFYWIDVVLMITGTAGSNSIYIFKTLSAMSVLRLLKTTPGTNTILHSLKKSTISLANVGIFIAFFFVIFCIIGVQGFDGSFERQCVSRDPSQNIVLDQSCGGYYEANSTKKLPFITQSGTASLVQPKGYICPMDFVCRDTGAKLHGSLSFDTVYTAFVPVFVLMTGQTWSDLMYRAMDAEYGWSSLYFIFVMIIMNFWILNLFITVINEVFSKITEEYENKSAFTTRKRKSKETKKSAYVIYGHTDENKNRALQWIEVFWVIVVIVDLVYQCLPQYDTPTDQLNIYRTMEFWLNTLFILDIVIRFFIFGLNYRAFFTCSKNLFDLFLVFATMIIQIPAIRNSESYVYLTIFQVLRIYRPIFLIEHIRSLVRRVVGSWYGILNVTLFIWFFLAIISVLFGLLFRESIWIFSQTNPAPTMTFQSFYLSFLGVFQVFSGENWTDVLYSTMEAALPWHQVAIAALFMIAFYSFANFVLISILITIIMENFGVKSEEEKHRKQQRHFIRTLNCTPLEKHKLKFYLKNYLEPRSHDKEQVEQLETEEQVAKQEVKRKEILYCEKLYREYTYRLLPLRLTPAPELGSGPAPGSDSTQDSSCSSFLVRNSLFIFKPNNKIRNSLQLIIRPIRGRRLEGVEHNANYSRVFHFIIFLAIIASLVTAAITTPVWHLKQSKLNPDDQSNTITVSNLIFPIIFTVEFLMRVIADGFMFTPDAYMKSFWNVLDLFVLVSMYIPIITNASDTQGYSRVLRSFKSLRVLRVINLSEYAKDTLYTVLIAGFPQLFNAAALCLCLLVPFAIYGMHLFSGKFFSCNDGDASVVTLQDCMGTFANNNNVTMPRVWSNPSYSFDNFMASFLILFELTSQEGWIGVMETAQAVTGLGKQPVPKASLYQSFFFVVFSYIGGLIVSSLFVAVVVENYEKQSGAALMSPGQKRWMGMKKLLESTHMSKNHLRKSRSPTPDLEKSPSSDGVPSPYSIYYRLWDWVRCKDSWFPMVFDFLTVIIAIALMSEYARINNWELIKNGIFMAITILYMVENYIKIKGLGWTAYIWNRWNLYNGVMSALSLITTFLLICGLKWNPLAQAQKLLLTAILLRLIPRVTALNELLTTLAASFVSIASLFGVWLVVFAVYGIMFMEIFSLTSYGPNGGKNINFRRFGTTMLMMVRMSTGEGWNDIMHDFTVDHPDCISQPEDYLQSDCGSTPWAYSLFISFNVISMYIFTNMFIGVVMHNFSYVYDVDQGTKSPLNRKVLREFKEKWALVDVGATGYIEQRHILKFLMSLRGVFDMRSYQVPDPQNLDDDGDDDDFSVKRLKTLILKPELPKGPKEYLDLKLEDLKPLQLIKKIDKEKVKEIQRRRKMLNIIYVEIVRSMEPITTSEAKLSQKSFDWIRQIMNHGKDEKVSAGDENGRAGEGGKEGISFRKMLDIVARHKLVMDEQWFSVGGLIKHKQKMDEVHAILHALRGATFLTKTVLRRKFLKIYRYEQELNKGIKHSSEITSVGIAGINSTLSQEIEKLRSLLPNYIPEASLATLMKKLPKSPELSFDSTLKNLDSILESMKVTEEVPKPYNRRHFLKRFWNGLKKFLKEF